MNFTRGALTTLGLICAACDDAAAPTFDTTTADGVAGDVDTPYAVDAPACRDRAAVAPLSPGRWASRQVITGLVALPPTGTLSEVKSTMLVLHDVVDDDGIRVTNITCSLTQPRLSGVETVFGPAFIAAVPRNQVSATVDGTSVDIAGDRIVLGATLTDPATEALPTDAEDPRVSDMDEDALPGMTVTLQGLFQAQLYITYRHFIGLSGRADESGCIAGTLSGTREQTQLGASDDALLAFDFSPQPHPDPDINTFVMVPVSEGLSCAELIAGEAALFGP